jgi:hypothetical protein
VFDKQFSCDVKCIYWLITEFNILVVPLDNNEMTTKFIDFETAKPAKPDDRSSKDIEDLIDLFKEMYIGHTEEVSLSV